MATIIRADLGREGHYRYVRLVPGQIILEAAECECGATWTHTEDTVWGTFCEWANGHQTPTIVRATVQCAGGLVREQAVDGNGVAWCPSCHLYRPVSPQPGYEGWYQFDPHPIFVAVKP